MKTSTKDRIEGALHEVKGKVKEAVGRTINDPKLENEGHSENFSGKVQKKLSQVEQVFEK